MTKTIYTQGKQVGSFNNWDELRIGANHPAFIWQGDKLVYPNPILDGLVLWFDFSGMTNSDTNRGIATDLSGNGNHGTLQNFNYTSESGYDKNKLLFDGVDDYIGNPETIHYGGILDTEYTRTTISFIVQALEDKRNNLLYSGEQLKIDVYGNSVKRQESPFRSSISHDFMSKPVHVAMVTDGTNLLIYLDGELKGKGEYNESEAPKLQVGNIGYYIAAGRPNIDLYDVKIYGRPLSEEEIQHNYQIEKQRFNIEGED